MKLSGNLLLSVIIFFLGDLNCRADEKKPVAAIAISDLTIQCDSFGKWLFLSKGKGDDTHILSTFQFSSKETCLLMHQGYQTKLAEAAKAGLYWGLSVYRSLALRDFNFPIFIKKIEASAEINISKLRKVGNVTCEFSNMDSLRIDSKFFKAGTLICLEDGISFKISAICNSDYTATQCFAGTESKVN